MACPLAAARAHLGDLVAEARHTHHPVTRRASLRAAGDLGQAGVAGLAGCRSARRSHVSCGQLALPGRPGRCLR